jgi:hypothetical protein
MSASVGAQRQSRRNYPFRDGQPLQYRPLLFAESAAGCEDRRWGENLATPVLIDLCFSSAKRMMKSDNGEAVLSE